MEEVIEQLRELNEPVPVPLELPDEELLVEIEEQLLINLPFELREFLLKVSDVVYGHLEPVTVTDQQSHTFLPEVAAVAGSNYAEIGFTLGDAAGPTRTLCVQAASDNLLKGGAGQAIQNMNLMLGLPETMALDDPGPWP